MHESDMIHLLKEIKELTKAQIKKRHNIKRYLSKIPSQAQTLKTQESIASSNKFRLPKNNEAVFPNMLVDPDR